MLKQKENDGLLEKGKHFDVKFCQNERDKKQKEGLIGISKAGDVLSQLTLYVEDGYLSGLVVNCDRATFSKINAEKFKILDLLRKALVDGVSE